MDLDYLTRIRPNGMSNEERSSWVQANKAEEKERYLRAVERMGWVSQARTGIWSEVSVLLRRMAHRYRFKPAKRKTLLDAAAYFENPKNRPDAGWRP